jgi:hypothetical protein
MTVIFAPWTDEEVRKLNLWQSLGYVHEFTCKNNHHDKSRTLTATTDGWTCPYCEYTQNWARDSMLNPPPPPFTLLGQK